MLPTSPPPPMMLTCMSEIPVGPASRAGPVTSPVPLGPRHLPLLQLVLPFTIGLRALGLVALVLEHGDSHQHHDDAQDPGRAQDPFDCRLVLLPAADGQDENRRARRRNDDDYEDERVEEAHLVSPATEHSSPLRIPVGAAARPAG